MRSEGKGAAAGAHSGTEPRSAPAWRAGGFVRAWRAGWAGAGAWFLLVGLTAIQGIETRIRWRWRRMLARPEGGMATAEYAIVTLAAVAFAGLLLVILRGGEVREMLLSLIREALSR